MKGKSSPQYQDQADPAKSGGKHKPAHKPAKVKGKK